MTISGKRLEKTKDQQALAVQKLHAFTCGSSLPISPLHLVEWIATAVEWQLDVFHPDNLAKSFRDLIPDMQVYEKRKIAFSQCILEFIYPFVFCWRGEANQIKIRIGARPSFDAGAIGPDSYAGDISNQQILKNPALLFRNVDRHAHSQLFPVIV
jgi:hypothetical protein